ncbi:MAG: YDG domain-containing protein [Thermomonas sp.]|uniref:two-partner secretion domain-containing protein n=1 Tax=Thermomonas sp. TaxID=1971895 RepID=UPI0039E2B7B6
MNHVYRIVFNHALGVFQVVAETATRHVKGRGKAARAGSHRLALLMLLPFSFGALAAIPMPGAVDAPIRVDGGAAPLPQPVPTTPVPPPSAPMRNLPTDGRIVSGSGNITQDGNTLTITQDSQKLIATWQGFDIGEGYTVEFLQPSRMAVALNRVLGNDPSRIFGTLKSNGQVFLINPHGVLFGKGAQVDVGGLVASSLDIRDADFLSGNYVFRGNGGTVRNEGSLRAHDGGAIALLGGKVANSGVIEARLGSVAMAAGSQVTLDFAGDGLLNVKVDKAALDALVENHGAIRADGGSVLLAADAGDALLQTVVNNTGLIETHTLAEREGRIVLLGGFDGGSVNVAGTLDAGAPESGNGGFIETSGAHVNIADGAVITTKSGSGQGGTWLIDPNDFTIAASGGNMTGAAVGTALDNNGSFIIQTANMGTAGGNGDIHVNDAINWSSSGTLTLDAERSVNVNAAITATGSGAGLVVRYNQGAGITDGNFYANAKVNLPVTGSLSINGQSYTLIDSLAALTDLNGRYALVADTTGTTAPLGVLAGTLEGLGHTVSGMNIDAGFSGTSNQGLFSGITATGLVRNLGVTGSVNAGGNIGLLAGSNAGSIVNSWTSGRVSGGGSWAGIGTNVGGLVGSNSGSIDRSFSTATVTTEDYVAGGLAGHNTGSITRSHATGDVSATYTVGGLVGINEGTLDETHATGNVQATNTTFYNTEIEIAAFRIGNAGGLAGINRGTISTSYAVGDVAGTGLTTRVGGVAGYNEGAATISNSYAAGGVSGAAVLYGGLAGQNDGTISNSFWDSYGLPYYGASAVGTYSLIGSGTVTNVFAVTSDPTQSAAANYAYSQSAYASLDFGSDWFMVDGETRPFLRSEWSNAIRNVHQLQLMAMDTSASYTLVGDVDARATGSGGMWTTKGFVAVGNAGNAFTGSLQGQGFNIDGLVINRAGADDVGLFGVTAGALLADITMRRASIAGSSNVGALAGRTDAATVVTHAMVDDSIADTSSVTGSGNFIGGLIGSNAGSVSDSSSSAKVQGGGNVGGLIGENTGTVSQSEASGAVSGTATVGGLVGWARGGAVIDSSASGDVSNSGVHTGGLIGANSATVTGSHATGDVHGAHYSGGLIGASVSGTVSNSHATGNVTGATGLGGLVGLVENGSVSSSYATGNVNGDAELGGLVGHNNGGQIANTYALGNVSGIGASLGGLVGVNNGGIATSYSAGSVSGGSVMGGLVGNAVGGSITSSYWDSYSSGMGNGVGQGNGSGASAVTSDPTQSAAANYAYRQGAYAGFDFGNDWFMVDGETRPFLRSEWSTVIGNAHQLQLMAMNLSADYTLGNDIDASATAGGGTSMWRTAGFSPVGNDTNAFTGSLDGKGHVIDGLSIQRAGSDGVGLFGVATGASLRNLSLNNAEIVGGNDVGALLGKANAGTVVDQVHVIGGSVSGVDRVGGLIGSNAGSVLQSYSSAEVTGEDDVGGLVGSNDGGQVSTSYAIGAVTGTGSNIGGLAGSNGAGGSIESSYSSGLVTGGSVTGGLVGDTTGGTITGSHWDSYTSGQANAAGQGDGSGASAVTSDPSQSAAANYAYKQSAYTGFDFSNDWFMVDGETRPFLRSEWSTVIRNANQLQLMAMDLTADYMLGNDIDASATVGGGSSMWRTAGFSPVGNASTAFSGSFDGKGHVIDGLSIQRGTRDGVGLFGYSDAVAFANVGLSNVSILGRNHTGALLGRGNGDNTLDNIWTSGTVASASYTSGGGTGGVAGYLSGGLTNVRSSANVSGQLATGGIVGRLQGTGSFITRSWATGDVVNSFAGGGGLVGYTQGSISYSHATGNVSGTGQRLGGLVGESHGNIDISYATGNVTGIRTTGSSGERVGGLVGYMTVGTISNAFATGNVTGYRDVGGLVGYADTGSRLNATYARGSVSGDSRVGGLIGSANDMRISLSYAANGPVTSNDPSSIGGLIGWSNNGNSVTIDSAVWDKESSGVSVASGNTTLQALNYWGATTAEMKQASTYGERNFFAYYLPDGSVGSSTVRSNANAAGNYFDPDNSIYNLFRLYDGQEYPLLMAFLTTLEVSANSVTTTYNGTTQHVTVPYTFVGEYDPSLVLGSSAGATASGRNVGTTDLVVGGLYSTQFGYNIILTGGGTFTIEKADLVISSSDVTKTYDGTTSANGSAVVVGGTLFGSDSLSGGNFAFADKNAGTGKTVTVGGVTVSDGNGGGNYNVTYADNTGSTILQKVLTISGTNANDKTYDGTTAASFTLGTLDGLVGGETLGVSATGEFDSKDAGSRTATAHYSLSDGGNGGLASNYTLADTSHSATINKASLSVTANDAGKTYDGVAWSGGNGVSYSGFVNGEDASELSGTLVYDGDSQGAVNAGSYTITANGLTSGNYDISYFDGTLTIDPKVLTLILGNLTGTVSKTYDGTTNATLDASNFLLTGWVGSDGATVTKTSGYYADANAGSGKLVTVDLASGDYLALGSTDLGNYILPTQISGYVGIINKALATVTANSATYTYNGQTQNVTGYTVSGLVNGEDESVLDSVVEAGGSGRNAGSYAHTVSGSDNNYALTFVDGTLTIDKALATVTANSGSFTYNGQTQSVTGYTVDGLVNGENESVLDSVVEAGGSGRNAGSYAHTVSGSDNNYELTFVNGALTIDKAAITLSTGDVTKTYDGTTAANGSAVVVGGTLFGDDSLSGGSFAYTDKNAGTGKTVTVNGVTVNDGNGGGNYDVTYADNTGSVINKANATVTANSDRVYYNGLLQSVTGFTVSGLVNGENKSVLTGLTESGGSGRDVGRYVHRVSGSDGNYALTFVDGELVVDALPSADPGYASALAGSAEEPRKPIRFRECVKPYQVIQQGIRLPDGL